MNKYKIAYVYGTYSGIRDIYAEDSDSAIIKMWKELKPFMSLSMAYQSASIISVNSAD